MKIYSLKRKTIPKIAVLATGLAGALLVATINPMAAQATPRAANCTGCHADANGAVSTVTAAPSTTTPVAGASYTVAITLTANPTGGNSGYAILPVAPATEKTFGGNTGADLSFTATMVAPAAAGTYSYTVYTNQGPTDAGLVGSKVYSITVAPVVTTPPPTTTTSTPPPTTTTSTPPPETTTSTPPETTTSTPPETTTSTPPETTTSTPPETTTSTPPETTTTTPPESTTTTTTTTPPVTSIARIRWLSTHEASVGAKVKIKGTDFRAAGVVKFGTVVAKVSSWTSTQIVVSVPAVSREGVKVIVTPKDSAASNGVKFEVKASHHGHHGARHHVSSWGHFLRLMGDFDF